MAGRETMAEAKRPLAFITGAAGGVGAEAAKHFAGKGFRLWLTDRDGEALSKIAHLSNDTLTDVVDLTDAGALEALCQNIETREDAVAVAFINAGVIAPGRVVDLDRKRLDFHLDVNLRAAMHLNHALARRMVREGSGQILNTLSTAAMISLPESAAYSASKFGLRGFLIGLAKELEETGVAISCLYPNAIDTPMLRYEALHGGSALNFLSEPLAIADVIKALDGAHRTRRLETFIPASDTATAKLGASFPGLVHRLYGFLAKRGEKGREKFIRSRNLG